MLFQYLIEVAGSQPFTQTDVEPKYFILRHNSTEYTAVMEGFSAVDHDTRFSGGYSGCNSYS